MLGLKEYLSSREEEIHQVTAERSSIFLFSWDFVGDRSLVEGQQVVVCSFQFAAFDGGYAVPGLVGGSVQLRWPDCWKKGHM